MAEKKFDYKKERSSICLKYGIEMDDTTCGVLYVLREEQKEFFENQEKKLDRATEKISRSKGVLQVDQRHPLWQAFFHGLGSWGVALITASSLAALVYITKMDNEHLTEKRLQLLEWYRSYYDSTRGLPKKAVMDYLKKHPNPDNGSGNIR